MTTLAIHGIDPERIRAMTAHMRPTSTTPSARIVKEPWREPRGRRQTGAATEIRAAMAKLGRFTVDELAKFCGHKVFTVRHVISRQRVAGNLETCLAKPSASKRQVYRWIGGKA